MGDVSGPESVSSGGSRPVSPSLSQQGDPPTSDPLVNPVDVQNLTAENASEITSDPKSSMSEQSNDKIRRSHRKPTNLW